jgi:cytoskeletal protein RodZ
MQFKDFISKKVLVSVLAVVAVGLGVVAGLIYRSAHTQQLHSNPNNSYNQYSASTGGAAVADASTAGNADNVSEGPVVSTTKTAGSSTTSSAGKSSTNKASAKSTAAKSKTSTSPNSSSASGAKSASTAGTTTTTGVDASCPIKGETNSKGKKVFYLANNKGYKRAKSEQCFSTMAEALAAGYANAAGQ